MNLKELMELIKEGEPIDYPKYHWYSDWAGDEVGYDDINIVGLYGCGDVFFYVDTETGIVLEAWEEETEE